MTDGPATPRRIGDMPQGGPVQAYCSRRDGLPAAVSPHNNHYLWRPGRDAAPVLIMVGSSGAYLAGACAQVDVADRVRSPYAMPFETRWPIHLCRGLKLPLDEAWRPGQDVPLAANRTRAGVDRYHIVSPGDLREAAPGSRAQRPASD